MVASKSQNLPGVLDRAAAYSDATAQLPTVSGQTLAPRAAHFASAVRFSLYEPEAMQRLHEVTDGLRGVYPLASLLPRVLDGALSLMGADFGNIQLLDPVTGSLRIVTQSGFGPEFIDYFAVVNDDHSACGRAAQACAQAVIADVSTDPGFAPHRDIAAASGFGAVQSTPLVDYVGRLIGIVSTHHQRPHRPSGADLKIMELYGDLAGEAVARQLGRPAGDDLGDPLGWAVISALLDPGNGHGPSGTAPSGPGGSRNSRGRGPGQEAASQEDTMSQFAEYIAHRLLSVGLGLESARSIIGKGPAGDRVAAMTDEVDRLVRDIRTLTFRLAADRRRGDESHG